MVSKKLSSRAGQFILLLFLLAGSVSCSREVSDSALRSAKLRETDARGRLAEIDAEVKSLHEEARKLSGYGGPGHADWIKKVDELKKEKQDLEAIKAEVEAKVAAFGAAAKAHRETITKGIP